MAQIFSLKPHRTHSTEVWHEEGHLYGLAPDGSLVDRSAAEFFKAVAAREPSQHLAEHDAIIRPDG